MFSYNKFDADYHKSGVKPLPSPLVVSNIFSAHHYNWKEKFNFSGESHKYHEAVFVYEGEVTVSEDDRIYHLSERSLILHAPYEFHRIATDTGAKVMLFSFETEELFPEAVYDGFFVLSIEEAESYRRLFDKIYEFYHLEQSPPDPTLALEIASLLPSFFLSLSKAHSTHHSAVQSRSEAEYKKIVEVMRESVSKNLSLEDVAKEVHMSVSYLKHLFHKYAGVGAKHYYATLRLNEVIKLLECDLSIAEIAARLNFSSPEYLSLFFKKHTGLPPGKFKSQNRR